MKHNKNNKIIVWTEDIHKLIDEQPIGGIAVQMFFWAQVFSQNEWQVYSFAKNAKNSFRRENITFKPIRSVQRFNFFLEWWYPFKFLLTIQPNVIIYRGANRALLPLSLFAQLFGVKLVFFSASDVNFEPGKELVGSKFNRKLYHRSIRHIRYFVTQNKHQHNTLLNNYGKESLMQFNIWGNPPIHTSYIPPVSDAVWVANFRRLKRAEWVIKLATEFPRIKFVMAGGTSGDCDYYFDIKEQAERHSNIMFIGAKPFVYINELVRRSRVLLCTSTFEGFPNTFLQAWSKGVPVISTVDPSNLISNYHLGEVVNTEEELRAALQRIIKDKEYYHTLKQSKNQYFTTRHAAQTGYNNVINYIQK